METRVGKHVFVYGTQRYFRGNAPAVTLGSWGEKKDPIGAKAYLAAEGRIAPSLLRGHVRRINRARIDWSRQTEADYEAQGEVKYFEYGATAAMTADYGKAKSAQLELLHFVVEASPLKRILNTEADHARKELDKEGNDGRVVDGVWVVVSGQIAESFSAAGTSAGSVVAEIVDGLGLTVTSTKGGGRDEDALVTLEPKTVFAYSMQKVRKWKNGLVEDFEDDFKGMG
ncbi:hypothetical protein Bcav_3368 [Beutenbergia cavernae DSM 12333]|uniref:Uncharacterized protein n=1 Tax=Beutenbergia cavernae (strain ATCC BAA-8 / DSM 12333 / CCUG 43141 / JCM 11478 / NBRC 16432 / NCIMB 13614 / HKI 0122) TaxID=471853 RepID=C5C1K0_BEUC1|nr:hypothetical protein [Beutenbergia cavernae]ACQ81610.1 hypothetical protein Bcav_3368 [Beutenbergia cavernae DSM 12333]